jgi:hypothetical protein
VLVREYTESDLDALRAMHASQGFDYRFPNLDDPIFVSKLVLEDDSGNPAMASLARLTCSTGTTAHRADSAGFSASARALRRYSGDSAVRVARLVISNRARKQRAGQMFGRYGGNSLNLRER